MSINDEFYSHFPSLNSNSKENLRYKRISREYTDYMKKLKPISPRPTKNQQRIQRLSESSKVDDSTQAPSPTSSGFSSPMLEVIFSSEERNRLEESRKEENKKKYQEGLKKQIVEQKLKRLKDAERLKREEALLEK